MSEITLQLRAEIGTRKLIGAEGGTPELPTFFLGDKVRCQLKLYERSSGNLRERTPSVRSLRASIGRTMEPPASGTFKLSVGGQSTEAIAFNVDASRFSDLLKAKIANLSTVQMPAPSCWLFRNVPGTQISLSTEENTLAPASFVRFRAFQRGAIWWHEVRLIQTPLAFTGLHDRTLPDPPTVTRIQAGGSESENADIIVNEIQALHVPPEFLQNAGGYVLKFDLRQTSVLGPDDGPEELAVALNAMWKDGKERFKVSLPITDTPYIEFTGELEDQTWPLLEPVVKTHGPGTITFTLDLATAELAAALRTTTEIKVPFELELELVADGADPEDPEVPGTIFTAFQYVVTITREGIWPELATIPAIDWLRPPSPRSYVPFAPGQIITGSQHYTAVFGNGVGRSFSFPHALGTAALHATVRGNSAGGRVRVNGVDYTLHAGDEAGEELILEIPEGQPTPGLNALAITISTAGPASAFQQHNHEIGEITGLQTILNTIAARVTAIENLLPTVIPSLRAESQTSQQIAIPDLSEVYPGRFASDFVPANAAKDGSGLPRPAGLLPAIHDATVVALTVPIPAASAHEGEVFQNQTGNPVLIAGGLGRRGAYLAVNGYAGSDGRVWYPLTRDGSTNSYFPSDFERELFVLPINERMLRAGQALTLDFKLTAALLKATTKAQILVVIEVGSVPQQTTPAPVGVNLLDVTWNTASPVLSQQLILSGLPIEHKFGAAIRRDALGALTADALFYEYWEGNKTAPSSANFAIRARLIGFDTENSATNERGFVFFSLAEAKAEIA